MALPKKKKTEDKKHLEVKFIGKEKIVQIPKKGKQPITKTRPKKLK